MFKRRPFILEKKYYKNIKTYIIGLKKNFFVNQFKNKIRYKYIKKLSIAIATIKQDIKRINIKK